MLGTVSADTKSCSFCTFFVFCFVGWVLLLIIPWMCSSLLQFPNHVELFSLSFQLSNMAFCKHSTPILFAQDKTCSFVILLISFVITNSLIISAVITWLFMWFMNFSFSLLFPFTYILWLWPSVYPSTFLLIHLNVLEVYSIVAIMPSHYATLLIYQNVYQIVLLQSHISHSTPFWVLKNCNPSLTSHFFLLWVLFLHHLCQSLLLRKCFLHPVWSY